MDHVALVALFEEATRQDHLEAAEETARMATAAQGDSKGITKMVDSLRRAGGIEKTPQYKDITEFGKP